MTNFVGRPTPFLMDNPANCSLMGAYAPLLGTFMAVLDFFIVNIAIPDLQRGLHATDAQIQMVVAGYGVSYGSMLVLGARIGDRFGRKRMFLLGTMIFMLASAFCGLATRPDLLIVGRVLQGLAAALFSPQVLASFNATLAGPAKAKAIAAYGFVMGVASVFAQLIGGVLIHENVFGIGWRSCFLINLPVGVAACALVLGLTPESRASTTRTLDYGGMALIATATLALTIPLIEGHQLGWPTWSIWLLAGCVPLFALFVYWEAREKRGGARSVARPHALQ